MSKISELIHEYPAVTGRQITRQDGGVDYEVTVHQARVGVWDTGIGEVGITKIRVERGNPSVTVDCTRNTKLQGALPVDKREVLINPQTAVGADKISSGAFLVVNLRDIRSTSNGQGGVVYSRASENKYGS